jgi:tetratricopeptide (TPR) repeat protein
MTKPYGNSDLNKTLSLVAVIIAGLILTIALSRWIDSHRMSLNESSDDESLYLNGKTARRLSLAFNGLAADWYWMRSLQYVGRKIINLPSDVELDNLAQLNLKTLAPLLDTATTLDPQFLDPYEYAAVVLPSIDINEAIRITQKGVDANPTAWKLYQHLGYIYWQQGDFKSAADAYGRGAEIPGAPPFFSAMKARMLAEGGSRNTAREIYKQMFEQSTDDSVKEMARRRLMQVDSLDERDALRRILSAYQTRAGHCPENWKELEPVLRSLRVPVDSAGAPLDPSGAPYVLKSCDVELDPKSEVPGK